jgi:DNA polymerase III subunit delta
MAEPALEPVYLVAGSDRPKVATAVRRLRRHFVPESVERVAAQEASGADVVSLCNAGSLFGDRRLVIVDDVDGHPNAEGQLRGGWRAGDVDAVIGYLKSPAPDVVLALVAHAMRRDSPLAKACSATGGLLVYDVAKRRVIGWVSERFQEHGVVADPDACATLVQLVGDDFDRLASEIDKIATWADGEAVGVVEIEHLVAVSADTPVYAITDAWGQRDLGRALSATEAALERAGRPVPGTVAMIAAHLARQVGIVRRARLLEDSGASPKTAMSDLGVRHEFQARRAFEFSRNFSEAELDSALVRAAELDHSLKGGSRLHPDLELERALIDVTADDGQVDRR